MSGAPDNVTRIRVLAEKHGLDGGTIAVRLGLTKGQVMGLVYRHNITLPGSPNRPLKLTRLGLAR